MVSISSRNRSLGGLLGALDQARISQAKLLHWIGFRLRREDGQILASAGNFPESPKPNIMHGHNLSAPSNTPRLRQRLLHHADPPHVPTITS